MTHIIINTFKSETLTTIPTTAVPPPPPPPWPWPILPPISLTPAPSPTTPLGRRAMVNLLPIAPLVDQAFDVATFGLIFILLFLSLLSVFFILRLRLKSRSSYKLQNFSSHWTVRFLLITFIFLWASGEFLRLPFFRRSNIFPFMPPFSFIEQSLFCKVHTILSLGLFEPGFLITLLFLVNISIKKESPSNLWAVGLVVMTCLPLCICLYLSIFYLPGKLHLPEILYQSSAILVEDFDHELTVCTYPLLSTAVFGVFGGGYALVFLLSCWKVGTLAINRRLKGRINTLALTVLICLFVQIGLLSLSVLWGPEEELYYFFVLIVFASVVVCAAVGEGVLVLRPVSDALSVGGDLCRWGDDERRGQGVYGYGGGGGCSDGSRPGMRTSPTP